MAKRDPDVTAHLEWLGFIQPTGLVVSAPALAKAGAVLDRHDAEGQRLLRACACERRFGADSEPRPHLPDFRLFASTVLGWSFSAKGYAGTDRGRSPLNSRSRCPTRGETLRPDYAVIERDPGDSDMRGNCSCRCSTPAGTSTGSMQAPAAWTPRPTVAWNACCGPPASPRGCCSTAAPRVWSRRRAARVPAGWTSRWSTCSRRPAALCAPRSGCC